MEIAPKIHALEGVRGSNSVLLMGEQMAVVDTGYPGNTDAIMDGIKALGRSTDDLRWIILTHHHHDHSGTAAELAQAAVCMATLPPHVNMLEAIVLPVGQLYVGRG